MELFPKHEVSAIAAADALWRHTCRFTAPLDIVTDHGSQFVNQMLAHFHDITDIKHHMTIPYSKEENGLKYIIVIIDTFSRYVELFPNL